MKLGDLKNFVKAVEKKYGRKALKMPVEVQNRMEYKQEVLWVPYELSHLGVGTYPEDEENPEETVIIIR